MSAQGTCQAAQVPETFFDPTSNSQDSYVIALDQGTTSSRAVLVDRSGYSGDHAKPLPADISSSGLGGA